MYVYVSLVGVYVETVKVLLSCLLVVSCGFIVCVCTCAVFFGGCLAPLLARPGVKAMQYLRARRKNPLDPIVHQIWLPCNGCEFSFSSKLTENSVLEEA